jgi:hypothetical protein
MLAQLRPGPALIYCKSAQMSDSCPYVSKPFDSGKTMQAEARVLPLCPRFATAVFCQEEAIFWF